MKFPIPARHFRKAVIATAGTLVLLFGIALLALPGPGLLVMAAGLSILAIEFQWAKRWLDKIRTQILRLRGRK